MWDHTLVQTKSCFLYSPSHYLPVVLIDSTIITRVVKQLEVIDLANTKKQLLVCTTVWSHIYIRDALGKQVPIYCDNDTRIPLCCWHLHNTIRVRTIVSPEYRTWRFSFTILPYYFTALIISKNFHILSSFNVNKMGSHWVLFLLYLNIVRSWPEDGRLRPKHVAKYNLIVIIAFSLDAYCVLTKHNILYKFDIHNGMASLSLSHTHTKRR
jgi:hypothetical protein